MQQYAITVTVKPSKLVGGRYYDSLPFDKQCRYLNDSIRCIVHNTGEAYAHKTQFAWTDELIFEHHDEGKRRLHAHGLISTFPENIDELQRELIQEFRVPGETRSWYNVRIEPIYHLNGWKKYIHKNQFDLDKYLRQLQYPDEDVYGASEDSDIIFDTNIFIK